MDKRLIKVKFKNYAFQTIMTAIGVGTAGMIIFTFITIVNHLMLWIKEIIQ